MEGQIKDTRQSHLSGMFVPLLDLDPVRKATTSLPWHVNTNFHFQASCLLLENIQYSTFLPLQTSEY
jgi:hypothetical protein